MGGENTKARITNKVSSFGLGPKRYVPGDIVEIEERQFNPGFMEKIVEAEVAGIPIFKAPQSAVPTVQETTQPASLPPTVRERKPRKEVVET